MGKRYGLGAYLAGAVAARTGDEMSGPALLLAGFALTGSAASASALLAGLTVAAAAGGPVLGALLDRRERPGRLLAGALAAYAAGLTVLLAGLGRLPFALCVAIAVLTGLAGPALSGGWTAQLPQVAAGPRLPRANALDALTFTLASLAGPALAGGLAEAANAPAAVAASAALIAAAAPAAWALPGAGAGYAAGGRGGPAGACPPQAPPGGVPMRAAPGGSVRRDLLDGVRFLAGRERLRRATLTSVGCSAAQGVLAACLPLLGEREFGDAGRGALLLSCAACSALAAGAVLARFPRAAAPDTVVWAGALVQAAALVGAACGSPALLVAGLLLAGAGEGPQLTALFAVRHREAPEALRARVLTIGASLKITGFALGAAAAGPVAARSTVVALTAAAALAALSAVYGAGPCRRAVPARAADRPGVPRRVRRTGRTTSGR